MRYFFESIRTRAYWRYALFSGEAIGKFFAVVGILYLCVDLADAFNIYKKDHHSYYGLLILVGLALLYVLSTRRPLSRVSYKVPQKDFAVEVMIGDLFKIPGEVIISTSSTFDTDMSSGLIAVTSLQGQLATNYFNGQTTEIDRQIEVSLSGEQFTINDKRPGKKKEYPIGTVARVSAHSKNFYLVAMSHMDETGNASSDLKIIDEALDKLWINLASKAEVGDIVMPLMGTGRGRVPYPRKKMIERIAQSFADACNQRAFSNKLIIIVRPEDASRFSLNLFQVRDYLGQSLHT
ncbi:macro domain-containing protein [Pseudomonas sp. Irchel 3A5]|uniref:macro domain-containing protein n=1 Tax=Pseudomonas sp. Irchel 3A5 TaxID=2008911 RepID=UPI000BA4CFDD|nr:macro domain-containing protein [Pseudomonas sp. Irchel 3A5]